MSEEGRIYTDFDDWWSHGKHPWSSASRDIAEETWKDFEPTIKATRDDYIALLLHQIKQNHERHIDMMGDVYAYVKEHNLEPIVGCKMFRWLLDRRLGRTTKPDYKRYAYKDNIYTVMGRTLLKHPTTGEWVEAVQYINVEEPFTVYTREKEDFYSKFQEIT